MSVATVELSRVCRLDRRTIVASEALGNGLEFVGMEHVDPETGQIAVGQGSRTGEGKGQAFLFDDRHVLFGKLRPYLRKIALPRQPGCASTELVPLLPDASRLDRGYLFHWVRRQPVIDTLMAKNTGARMPRADMSVLLDMPIPVPPLDEQRRIVGLLDLAAEIRRRADAARAKARAIIPALFLDTFGDPAINPKGWDISELARVADIGSGLTKGRKMNGQKTEAAPYLRVANVQDGYLNLSEIKMIEATVADIDKCVLRNGDLLMTEGGDPDKLGRCAIWRDEVQGCLHQNHIFRVRVGPQLLSEYAAAYMQSAAGKSYFLRVAKRTTGIASVNKTQLGALPVLMPPLPLQAEFVAHVHRLKALAHHLDSATAKAETMAAGLSAEVFG
ncbi:MULTISPECIES: restriction endonuclease subunit S [unclassified Inquilinus]|uniref:restriction endonuclease subunit S n=1 Tax=unclassified Inquilinus TaxID=2645927 RepID=UPI003F91662B